MRNIYTPESIEVEWSCVKCGDDHFTRASMAEIEYDYPDCDCCSATADVFVVGTCPVSDEKFRIHLA